MKLVLPFDPQFSSPKGLLIDRQWWKPKGYFTNQGKSDLFCIEYDTARLQTISVSIVCYCFQCFVYILRASSLDKNKVNAILAFLKSIRLLKDIEINITMTEFQNINKIAKSGKKWSRDEFCKFLGQSEQSKAWIP